MEVGSIPESSQVGPSLLPSFPPSVTIKTNWDISSNSILLLGVLIGKAIYEANFRADVILSPAYNPWLLKA